MKLFLGKSKLTLLEGESFFKPVFLMRVLLALVVLKTLTLTEESSEKVRKLLSLLRVECCILAWGLEVNGILMPTNCIIEKFISISGEIVKTEKCLYEKYHRR